MKTIIALLALSMAGCSQYKRLIGQEEYDDNIPACSNVAPLDITQSDAGVMADLTGDQRTRLDNQSPFFDARPVSLQYVRDIYSGAQPFPPAPGGFSCLDETEFHRAVDAASNLGRFPL